MIHPRATTEFVYFDGYVQGGNVALRPFGQGSLMGELGEELGLTNAWTCEVDPAYGLGTTDIEGSYVRGAHGPGYLHVIVILAEDIRQNATAPGSVSA